MLISATLSAKMPKFCANLSFMFTERPFLERYKLAQEAGFKAVETGFPFGLTEKQVVEAQKAANIEQVLINTYTGDVTKGEVGFAAIPGKENDFKSSLETTLKYAKAVGAKKIHIMAGKVDSLGILNDEVYERNLTYAAKLLQEEGFVGLIEPINRYSVPNYYLNNYERGELKNNNVNG